MVVQPNVVSTLQPAGAGNVLNGVNTGFQLNNSNNNPLQKSGTATGLHQGGGGGGSNNSQSQSMSVHQQHALKQQQQEQQQQLLQTQQAQQQRLIQNQELVKQVKAYFTFPSLVFYQQLGIVGNDIGKQWH
jgi:flagellar motor protein MotB